MSEAIKLPPIPERDPPILALVPADALPSAPSSDAPPQAAQLAKQTKTSGRLGRATNVVLILFVVGLVAFIAGIAVASVVVSGAVDLNTGWVKDLLQAIKELAATRAT